MHSLEDMQNGNAGCGSQLYNVSGDGGEEFPLAFVKEVDVVARLYICAVAWI